MRVGHYQKDCLKTKAWFEKKGNLYTYVCFKSNLFEVLNNTWWLDFGPTIYVSNVMKGFLMVQTKNSTKDFPFMGNRMKAPIEGIATYRLILDNSYHLDLL